MAKDESSFSPHEPGATEPLSATGMFRRVFEVEEENAGSRSSTQASPQAETGDEPLPAPEFSTSAADSGAQEPGEFTRLFERVQPGLSAHAQPGHRADETGENKETGEFTRVFRSGGPGQESKNEPTPLESPVQQRGFSSPGKSESAAAGSVTQLFRAPAPFPSKEPVSPKYSATKEPDAAPVRDEDRLASAKAASPGPAVNITSLLESLSMQNRARPEAANVGPQFPAAAPAESGGVTNFIQKLGEEPPVAPQAPARPVEEPDRTGPGEFTRMVARAEEKPGLSIKAEPAAATAPAARATPAARTLPAAPCIAPPTAKPIEIPAAPAPPKTKLESMAPVLTVLNTVLLIMVLILLLLRSR